MVSSQKGRLIPRFCVTALLFIVTLSESAHAAGLTLITHGLNGNADGWVTGMAEQIPNHNGFPGTNFTFYRLNFTPIGGSSYQLVPARLGGNQPSSTDSGEIIVALDWSLLSDGNSFNTFQVASAVVPALTSSSFISELNGHALSELPIHLVGHSRGGSLACEISRQLGTNGVWVDHLTTLDPHPLNDPAFPLDAFAYSAVDAPALTYQNVLFSDNYWQDIAFLVYGKAVPGAYTRQLYNLLGGYQNIGDTHYPHSNVHLWYHGTVDERYPADDTEAQLSTEFTSWYTPNENYSYNAGFKWSLIGRGDRTSYFQPEGPGYPMIRDGFNQDWDMGAGQSVNRTALPSNNGNWPNIMRFDLISTNQIQVGSNALFSLYFQWAKPNTSTATISLYLDDDFNPFNGNSRLLQQVWVAGTGTSGQSLSYWSSSSPLAIQLKATNAPIGYHALYAQITGGGKSRYLYASEIIQVLPAVIITSQPSAQTVWAGTNVTFDVAASGNPTLKYQWRKNGANVSGATNAICSILGVTTNAAGVYSCLVSNTFGNAVSSNATLTVLVPDTTIPTNIITAPVVGQRLSNSVYSVTGTAKDNVAVSNVLYSLNGLAWTAAATADNWSNWTAQVTLTPGTNTIAAYSVDTSGNISVIKTVSFQFVVTNQLQVFATGSGTISPNYSNAWLEIGRNYSITSTPASGFTFANWIISTNWFGGVPTANPILDFAMQSNLTLQANFLDVTKPTLAITAPVSGQHTSNALATLIGTASDNWKVTGVWYQLNGGAWNAGLTSNGWTNWATTPVQLIAGTNTFKTYAMDLGGNYSTTNDLSIVSSNTFMLQLAFATEQPLASNGFNFSLQVSTGLVGRIQVSTDMLNWSALTNFTGTNGTLYFRDSAATNFSRRFYRAVVP